MAIAGEAVGGQAVDVDGLVSRHERSLFISHVVIATVFWLVLVVGTIGVGLVYLLFIFVGYLFAHFPAKYLPQRCR